MTSDDAASAVGADQAGQVRSGEVAAGLGRSSLFGHEHMWLRLRVRYGPGGHEGKHVRVHSCGTDVSLGELAAGLLLAVGGSLLAFNVKGWAEVVSDFLGSRLFSAFYHNDLALRLPAGFFAVFGAILASINLKILFFGF
ncbi:hypothetical protein ACFV6M_15905 [Streptomyces californicus]|uniref:hypothetical protein n=1 Tax=Streptomyces californicus TaxID=67351 RepID=UPI0036469DCC